MHGQRYQQGDGRGRNQPGDGPGRTPGSLFDAYKNAFAPRLGLAYRLNSKTVLRAYGGRVYAAVKTTGASTRHATVASATSAMIRQ